MPSKEYYEAKAELCRNLAIKQMDSGEGGEASKNLLRMVMALNEINLLTAKEEEQV